MKLKYEMTTMDMDGELMAIPMDSAEDFHGVLRMNDTTADILKVLETETTEEEIVKALLKEYDATEAQIKNSVEKVLAILRGSKLLAE